MIILVNKQQMEITSNSIVIICREKNSLKNNDNIRMVFGTNPITLIY